MFADNRVTLRAGFFIRHSCTQLDFEREDSSEIRPRTVLWTLSRALKGLHRTPSIFSYFAYVQVVDLACYVLRDTIRSNTTTQEQVLELREAFQNAYDSMLLAKANRGEATFLEGWPFWESCVMIWKQTRYILPAPLPEIDNPFQSWGLLKCILGEWLDLVWFKFCSAVTATKTLWASTLRRVVSMLSTSARRRRKIGKSFVLLSTLPYPSRLYVFRELYYSMDGAESAVVIGYDAWLMALSRIGCAALDVKTFELTNGRLPETLGEAGVNPVLYAGCVLQYDMTSDGYRISCDSPDIIIDEEASREFRYKTILWRNLPESLEFTFPRKQV